LKTTNEPSNLTLIVAVSENDVIGKDNDLIWDLKNDLKRFKALTSGHCIIMGRKTFESFPKPLPNRTHIVITRQQDYKAPDGVIVVNSLEAAIEKAKQDANPFIIGGGEIYKQGLNLVDTIEFTRVHHSFEGDTFFPVISETIWKEIDRIFHKKDDLHKFDFSYITYKRR
jgi:dihydrofolate reductase